MDPGPFTRSSLDGAPGTDGRFRVVVASVGTGGELLTQLRPDLPPSILSEALLDTWPTHAWPHTLIIAFPDIGLTDLDPSSPSTALHQSQRTAWVLAAAAVTTAHCAVVSDPKLTPAFRELAPHVHCSLLRADEGQDRQDLLLTRHPQPEEAYLPPSPTPSHDKWPLRGGSNSRADSGRSGRFGPVRSGPEMGSTLVVW